MFHRAAWRRRVHGGDDDGARVVFKVLPKDPIMQHHFL